jgi:hypothetical protein
MDKVKAVELQIAAKQGLSLCDTCSWPPEWKHESTWAWEYTGAHKSYIEVNVHA